MEIETKKIGAEHLGYHLTWRNVCLDISTSPLFGLGEKKTIRTLKNANGYARPGESLAIIGPSGAGKTTLLDILAQQKSLGTISGEILVNSKPPDNFFGKRSGYIFTAMAHIPTMTVRETLMFAAECRMPREATHAERVARVEEVIKNLRLSNAADTYVGDELIRGISSGEKKRTEVGIEMVAKPKALFFDEPTSGLDDFGARFTMELVLDYVRKENVTVMIVIHQPCEAVFNLFDNICIVGEQGRICYFGPRNKMEEHFTTYGYPTPPLTNPIEHYLDVMALDTVACHEYFEKSPLYQENLREIERINGQQHPDVPHSKNMVERTPLDQFKLIWKRCIQRYVRNPSTSWGRALLFLFFAIFFGLMMLNLTPDVDGIRNRLAVSSTLGFLPIFIAVAAVPQFLEDRELYIQEYNSAFYKLWPFWVTYLVIESIINIVISTLQYVIIFFMSNGFDRSTFWPAYGILFIQMILATTVAQAWSAWSKSLFQSYTALWAAGLVFYAFSGAQSDLKTIAPWIRWMADVNYWRWTQQYINNVFLKDYTYNCSTVPSINFVNGVVRTARSGFLNALAVDNSTTSVTTVSGLLGAVNSISNIQRESDIPADVSAALTAVADQLKALATPVLRAGRSADDVRPIASNYGAFDLMQRTLAANSSITSPQQFCAYGQGRQWIFFFRGIGDDEPATTNWAYFANGVLLIFFAVMTYAGLAFSRRYRKR